MQEPTAQPQEKKSSSRAIKIGVVSLVLLAVAGGAVAAVTMPSWAPGTAPSPSTSPPAAAGSSNSQGDASGAASQSPSPSSGGAPQTSAPADGQPADVAFTTDPADGAVEVNPAASPGLVVSKGSIREVMLSDSKGKAIAGIVDEGGVSWTASGPLAFNTTYDYSFTLVDSAGRESQHRQGFTTVKTANEADAAVAPKNGSTVGGGQPLQITFSEPVLDKKAMQEAITVTTTSKQPVKWHWYDDKTVRIRPEKFWAAGSTVSVDLNIFGVEFGNGMVGNLDATTSFTVGPSRLAVVDDKTKTMVVYIDGKKTKTFPVTLGDDDWLSPTGYAVVIEQERYSKFNAGSIGLKPGDKGYYPPLTVEHANRLTWSGVYVHQALPSAYSSVGVANVSHGCVGLLPADAAWFFNTFKPGDVVQTLNTGAPPVEPLEGWGDWNIAWANY